MTDKIARGIWPALATPFTDDGSALAPERVAPQPATSSTKEQTVFLSRAAREKERLCE